MSMWFQIKYLGIQGAEQTRPGRGPPGDGIVTQQLLSTYSSLNCELGAGAINVNSAMVLAEEELRGSWREKNTDPSVLQLLLPTALEEQAGRSKTPNMEKLGQFH